MVRYEWGLMWLAGVLRTGGWVEGILALGEYLLCCMCNIEGKQGMVFYFDVLSMACLPFRSRTSLQQGRPPSSLPPSTNEILLKHQKPNHHIIANDSCYNSTALVLRHWM
jgi:hypothetical protein